jgi:hypothetical protein
MQTLFAPRSLHESIKEFYGFFSEHIEDRARQKTEKLVDLVQGCSPRGSPPGRRVPYCTIYGEAL